MGDFTGRIDQLDAIDLDKELGQHFNGQLKEAVKYLPEIWLVKILPELEVILELSFHYLTFFSNKSSVGQKLLGLRIKDGIESWKLLSWISIEVLPKYLISRMSIFNNSRYSRPMEYIKMFISLAKFINYLLFFQEGKFPTLSRRILGIKLSRTEDHGSRDIGYSYLSREVLWHASMDMLAFILPLINTAKIKNFISKWIPTKEDNKSDQINPAECCYCRNEVIY